MSLFSTKIFKKHIIINFLFSSLIVSFIAGNLVLNANVLLIIVTSFFFYNIEVKISKIIKIIKKKYTTDICKDDFKSHFNIKIPFLVRLLGVEPRTSWSVAKRSIQLSYRRIFNFI